MSAKQRRMSVTGMLENVRSVCDFVVDFVSDVNLGDDIAFQSELAVEEICTNIVEHGYHYDGADKKIDIVCVYGNRQLQIRIIDDAPLFNPLEMDEPDPDTSLNDRDGGGWGVYFVKQYMTSVIYEVVDNRNNLVLTKQLS